MSGFRKELAHATPHPRTDLMTSRVIIISTLFFLCPAAHTQQSTADQGHRRNEANRTKQTQKVASAQDLLKQAANPLFGIRSDNAATVSEIGVVQPLAVGFNNRGTFWGGNPNALRSAAELNLQHQPLIQVKARIIEVIRQDNLIGKTVLDIVRDRGIDSLVQSHTLNNGNKGSTSLTRFPTLALPGTDLSGSGGIVNVTTDHLNIIGEFLATEFRADLVTCPQVVTLNGQKVQLISGVNAPFSLGQSVLHDGTLAVQNTFYKHVGTTLTVTPRIINWGPRGEGRGRRPITASEVLDWNGVAKVLLDNDLVDSDDRAVLQPYVDRQTLLMPVAHQLTLLNALNEFDRTRISQLLTDKGLSNLLKPLDVHMCDASGCPCDWNPSDCTLDIEIVLRQSNPNTSPTLDLTGETTRSVSLNAEEIGAAIANVVQLKNGHGAVLAGLIGERDVKSTSKVPFLGDLPVVGAAFRSRGTSRQKTEIVIFLEAEILPSDPHRGVASAAHDFNLTRSYLNKDVLCNPLEVGLQRAGIGSYLPPRSCDEQIFWEKVGRRVQKSSTAFHDIIR